MADPEAIRIAVKKCYAWQKPKAEPFHTCAVMGIMPNMDCQVAYSRLQQLKTQVEEGEIPTPTHRWLMEGDLDPPSCAKAMAIAMIARGAKFTTNIISGSKFPWQSATARVDADGSIQVDFRS